MLSRYFSSLKKLIGTCLVTLLVSCGGGSAQGPLVEAPITTNISLYGDSYSGSSWDISKLSNNRINLINYAVGGCTTSNARYGQPANYIPYGNFQLQMLGGDTSKIVVLRFGVAEAIREPKDSERFYNNLVWFIEQTKLANKQPILVNILQVPPTKFFEDNQLLPIFDEYNQIIESLALSQKVHLIDIRSQVNVTMSMMSSDEVHLTTQTSLIVDRVITKGLLNILGYH